MIKIYKLNNSFAYIEADNYDELKTIHSNMSYYVPGFMFMPSYKNGTFDGKVKLLDLQTKTFPVGLTKYVIDMCQNEGIEYTVDNNLIESFIDRDFNEYDFEDFVKNHKFFVKGKEIFPRDDQIEATARALKKKRCINICPTSFGKSLSITIQCLYLLQKQYTCLIVVPTKGLVEQFYNDIKDYATDDEGNIQSWYPNVQMIYGGKSKEINDNTQICISTWQSLQRICEKDKGFMNYFDCIVLDECFDGESLVKMEDGTDKKIKDIQVGDKIINYSEETKQFKVDTVINVYKNLTSSKSEKMYELKFDNGKIIKCTGNHKFFTNNGWKRADELTEYDEIKEYDIIDDKT